MILTHYPLPVIPPLLFLVLYTGLLFPSPSSAASSLTPEELVIYEMELWKRTLPPWAGSESIGLVSRDREAPLGEWVPSCRVNLFYILVLKTEY